MSTTREPVSFAWDGPFPGRRELPDCALYDVVLTFEHGANGTGVAAITAALLPLAGEPRLRRWPFGRPRLVWSHERWPMEVLVGQTSAEIRFVHRLKATSLDLLVRALGTVPGAQRLAIQATQTKHEKSTDSEGGAACCH